MVGADVVATDHVRPAGVAETFQLTEHPVSAPSSEVSAVLKSEPTRADLSDDSDGFEEEARPLAFDAPALGVGAGDVLTRRGPNDDVGNNSICGKSGSRERADFVIDFHPRIVFGV